MTEISSARRSQLMQCLDLTRLGLDVRSEDIDTLADQAVTSIGSVAALCIPPSFVGKTARLLEDTPVRVATVAGFPYPEEAAREIADMIRKLRAEGADEIDVVIPWRAANAGNMQDVRDVINAARVATGDGVLKVIMESGALQPEALRKCCYAAIVGGVDFLKTSTGMIQRGATPEAVDIMAGQIAVASGEMCHAAGVKVSGGVKTVEQASAFCAQVERAFGAPMDCDRFRIGASGLYGTLLDVSGAETPEHAY